VIPSPYNLTEHRAPPSERIYPMQTLSPNCLAVLTLINAQRQVCNRFDGSWWLLDFAKWEIVPTLRGAEWDLVHTLIRVMNQRAADAITVRNRAA
jgi:hypothetical protein